MGLYLTKIVEPPHQRQAGYLVKTRGFPSLFHNRFGLVLGVLDMYNFNYVCKNRAKLSGYSIIAWISYTYINYGVKTGKTIHQKTM